MHSNTGESVENLNYLCHQKGSWCDIKTLVTPLVHCNDTFPMGNGNQQASPNFHKPFFFQSVVLLRVLVTRLGFIDTC